MSDRKVETCNDIGAIFHGIERERMKRFAVYEERGTVYVTVEIDDRDALQYLDPLQAMAFAKAFEHCAIAALKNRA